MNLETQNWIVYGIVFTALAKFTFPIWKLIYKKLFVKKVYKQEDTSCYTGTCARCKIKT